VKELRDRGIRVGLASSSRNAVPIVEQAGIRNLFDEMVDGWFALVLGVDRKKSGALAPNGANWVINDFSKINADHRPAH